MTRVQSVQLGALLAIVVVVMGLLLLVVARTPAVDLPSFGTPTATTSQPRGSVPSSGRLPAPGESW